MHNVLEKVKCEEIRNGSNDPLHRFSHLNENNVLMILKKMGICDLNLRWNPKAQKDG